MDGNCCYAAPAEGADMASQVSAVVQNTLTLGSDGSGEAIEVGAPAWFEWLASAKAFRYECPDGHFTARSELASHGRGGWYWKAYRRSGGKLRRAYLGPSAHLTEERLRQAAAVLARPPAGGSRRANASAGMLEPLDVLHDARQAREREIAGEHVRGVRDSSIGLSAGRGADVGHQRRPRERRRTA